MSISPGTRCAVLTGDIVDSSKLAPAERRELPERIKQAFGETQKAYPSAIPYAVDVFRGDSWQLLVTDPVLCFRIALCFRCHLRGASDSGAGIETRIAVGIGPVDFVPKKAVSEGDGEAYRLSGASLESMTASRYLVLAAAPKPLSKGVDVAVQLIDAVAQGWTAKQARAIAGALLGWTQDQIAKSWAEPISQPAITKHLAAARWSAVEAGVTFVEERLRDD